MRAQEKLVLAQCEFVSYVSSKQAAIPTGHLSVIKELVWRTAAKILA